MVPRVFRNRPLSSEFDLLVSRVATDMLAKLVQQHHLKIFFSNKFVHTSVLNKVRANTQVTVSSNSKLFQDVLGEFAPKNDLKACLLAGSLLAKRLRREKACHLLLMGSGRSKPSLRV